MAFSTLVSSVPKNIDTIAGGASLAPRRWSLPALATLMRRRSWYSSTALITAARNSRKRWFLYGSAPGSSRFSPSTVPSDQLLCLPLPFTPSKGFSCSRHTRLCLRATLCISSMVSWLWSVAMLVPAKIGASSCWAGATSLCSVLASTPSSHSFSSSSFINALTRGLIMPK